MKTHNLKLHVLAALMACGSVFHVGCGDDDDDNATPSNTGGKASGTGGTTGSGGKATGTGGTTGSGGKATGTGGASTGTGGNDATAGAGNNTSEGGSGPEVTGGAGGASGGGTSTPEGGTAGQGGEAGGGGVPGGTDLPPCTATHYDDANECYAECEPKTNSTSEQFLNRCSEAGANCTKFDNSTLTALGANGALPPLP
jgi:hypothetical protein